MFLLSDKWWITLQDTLGSAIKKKIQLKIIKLTSHLSSFLSLIVKYNFLIFIFNFHLYFPLQYVQTFIIYFARCLLSEDNISGSGSPRERGFTYFRKFSPLWAYPRDWSGSVVHLAEQPSFFFFFFSHPYGLLYLGGEIWSKASMLFPGDLYLELFYQEKEKSGLTSSTTNYLATSWHSRNFELRVPK